MRSLIAACALALVGCGGGGGGSTPATPIVVATVAATSAPSAPPVTGATFSQSAPGAFPLSAATYVASPTGSNLAVTFVAPSASGTYQQFVQVDSQPAVMNASVAVSGAAGATLSSSILMPQINGSTTFTWVVFNGAKSAVYSAVYQR